MTRTPRPAGPLRGKTLAYLGAGLALAGAGAASTVAGFSPTPDAMAHARYDSGPAAAGHSAAGARTGTSSHPQARHAQARHAPARHAPARHAPARHAPAGSPRARHDGHPQPGHASHAAQLGGTTRHAAHVRHTARARHHKTGNWGAISRIVAIHSVPRATRGPLPAADRLTPLGTSGPQAWMPITTARYSNARAIVRQVLRKRMGLRAAVIAVATAMQESSLLNIGYGDRDSLGLFQQRPSAGWGTPQQILRPSYAADAFLNALHGYQRRDPAWAHQPLWEAAQGVQVSAFPYAYAKWEAQAAHLVAAVTRHLI